MPSDNPHLGYLQRIPGMTHPVTERFAMDLFAKTRDHDWPLDIPRDRGAWEAQSHEVREAFRERARRFMQGDMSMLPFDYPPGMVPRVGR